MSVLPLQQFGLWWSSLVQGDCHSSSTAVSEHSLCFPLQTCWAAEGKQRPKLFLLFCSEAQVWMLWFQLSLTGSPCAKYDQLPSMTRECFVLTVLVGCTGRPAFGAIASLTFENPSSISNRSATNSMYCFISVQFIPIRPTGNASVRNS